jgi:hypothetical protein
MYIYIIETIETYIYKIAYAQGERNNGNGFINHDHQNLTLDVARRYQ